MGFRVGCHKTLFKIGKLRFGIGYGMHGTKGLVLMLFVSLFYLMWWTILLSIWLAYAFVYLVVVLPIRLIKKLAKKKSICETTELNNASN